MDGSSFFTSVLTRPIFQRLLIADAQLNPSVEAADPVAADQLTSDWVAYGTGALFVLGIFVLPFVLSHFITRSIRMPAHSFRLGVMIAAIFGGLLFAYAKDFKLSFGTDMKGGTSLVYDIVPDEDGNKIDAAALSTALSNRINPSGTKEISIRPRGESQIEITVPMTGEGELQEIKRLLENSGQLEFRIVANTRDHQDIRELAEQQARTNTAPKVDVLDAAGNVVGKWYTVGRDPEPIDGIYPLMTPVLGDILRDSVTGRIISNPPLNTDNRYAFEKYMKAEGIRNVDVLMALQAAGKPYAVVVGDDLASAAMEIDKTGQPTIGFKLTPSGAQRMVRMTSINQPDGNFHRRMAIIMDGLILSAPQLNSPISNQGQIVGRFTNEEVEFLVNVLRSGRLPATLSDEPASEERVGAGLGATTIQKGTNASLWAIAGTFICILAYYRFAGVVASIALLINGLLIFGVMIFINQPLTLPGLAGLVLTVGMSVDANVLIYERIREEKNKGSAVRMAIRNGFDRAFTTIVDSNLTTLIAAVVLYWIGTDQVRGFAVALIIGIATSMFTATFCSRIIFEIAEKLKFVSLSMADGVGFLKNNLLGKGDFDFMSYRNYCYIASGLMILAGIGAVIARGSGILNIDFTGGTSVTFRLEEPIEADELRQITKEILVADQDGEPVESTLVRVEKEPRGAVYTLVTSIGSRELLSKQLLEGFAKDNSANLVTYRLKVTKGPSDATGMLMPEPRVTRMVGYQTETNAQEPDAAADANNQAPADATTTIEPSANSGLQPPTDSSSDNQAEVTDQQAVDSSTADSTNSEGDLAIAEPVAANTVFIMEFGGSDDDNPAIQPEDRGAKYSGPTLKEELINVAREAGIQINETLVEVVPEPRPENWQESDVAGYANWKVSLPVDDATATQIVSLFEARLQNQPLWLSLSQIGSKVAGEMQQRAVAAVLVSLIFIVGYIWFRFQKISYGLAAVVALVHDVVITLGVIAICHWLARPLSFLLIEDFKIGLTEVAAFLTIIGYSLNDTIVVFDRIREVRGRSPKLDATMINQSVNQTLSRTLLTSGTTLLTVIVLYVFGGEGIHAFSFALLVGILIGTYSSIFIASPVLLWLAQRESSQSGRPGSIA